MRSMLSKRKSTMSYTVSSAVGGALGYAGFWLIVRPWHGDVRFLLLGSFMLGVGCGVGTYVGRMRHKAES